MGTFYKGLCTALLHQGRARPCAECGTMFVPRSNRGKYCDECAAIVRRRQKAAHDEPDEISTFYVTDEYGTLYFYHGHNRIRAAEHFNDRGKPIGALIEDVIRCSAAYQMEKTAEN